MNTKKQLISRLEEQLRIEIDSKDLYTNFLKKITDKNISKNMDFIRKQEMGHISIVKNLINTIKNYKETVTEVEPQKEDILQDIFKDSNAVLLLSPVEGYMHKLISVIKNIKKKMIYLSFNKISKYTIKMLKHHNINTNNILFLDCVSDSNKGLQIDPQNLTGISIAITEALNKLKNSVVIIDTISAFSTYHNKNTILNFVGKINNEIRKKECFVLWVGIDDKEEKRLNDQITIISDTVVR